MKPTLVLPRKGERHRWDQQIGLGQALSIAQAAPLCPSWQVVVVPDQIAADYLKEAIAYFLSYSLPMLSFPDWETLPFDHFSPHQDITSSRLKTLFQLMHQPKGILIVPVATMMQRLCPPAFLDQTTFFLEKDQIFDPLAFSERLVACGYQSSVQVQIHGEFARRGSVFDVFPMGSDYPIRIELFDENIETLRTFDPVTQLTLEKTEKVKLYPAREFPTDKEAIKHFRTAWREQFETDANACPVYEAVSAGCFPPGIEYFFPLFFEKTATLFDYLKADTVFFVQTDCLEAATAFFKQTGERFEQYSHDLSRPILPVARLFLRTEQLFEEIGTFGQVLLESKKSTRKTVQTPILFAPLPTDLKENFTDFIAGFKGCVVVLAESAGRLAVLSAWLDKQNYPFEKIEHFSSSLTPGLYLGIGPAEKGVVLTHERIAILSESDLLGEHVRQTRVKKSRFINPEQAVRDLSELSVGQTVVHIEHGIGRYLGLTTLSDQPSEFMLLEYAGGDKLYVPVFSLHLIHRHAGVDTEGITLNRLGSRNWEKTKKQAAKQVADVAAQLLALHAKRALQTDNPLKEANEQFEPFCNDFPFELTVDQAQAVQAVTADLTQPKPMDRLICGDVGFGKTEIALRASFLCVGSGKQVAILVPTTLLAMQHFETFVDRFEPYGYKIALLSRFRTAKEQEETLLQLAAGTVDIVIGTHKLLSSSMVFEDLGLLIIDEEHRFGVKQKEKLKNLRTDVNLLTLTATPIPRTLNFGLSGVRDLSIIATPPAKRLSVKTFVREYNQPLMIEAIEREIRRGGQVFFLHNDVATMNAQAEKLSDWFPEARIGIAHGQMRERDLERVMLDFYHRRYQILCCTTIIETGIDVPSANTIIINRADRFGLAQLHQLRGRVGRSHHQAYAFLFIASKKALGKPALKRLEAIEQFSELGSGYILATQDLEIRGAGEILGENQSGQMGKIGIGLYLNLLQKTVKLLQKGEVLEDQGDLFSSEAIDINCQVAAFIPTTYIPDIHLRLVLYKRIANASTHSDLEDLAAQMRDRFGPLPVAVTQLCQLCKIKLSAQRLGIDKLKASKEGGSVSFLEPPKVKPETIIKLIREKPAEFRLKGSNAIRFMANLTQEADRLRYIETLLSQLEE